MGQYCFARWRLSSVVVCNAASGRADRPPGAWAVGRPILHGGPVRLRPVRTSCYTMYNVMSLYKFDTPKPILIIFGKLVAEKANNQSMLYFATLSHQTNVSALSDDRRKHTIESFH